MTPEEKQIIKERIEKRIIKTEREIKRLKDFTAPVSPGSDIGRLSRLEAINNKSIAEASLREHELRIADLRFQVNRLNHEDFGKCVKCGAEIPIGRIMAMPESTRCVKCAQT